MKYTQLFLLVLLTVLPVRSEESIFSNYREIKLVIPLEPQVITGVRISNSSEGKWALIRTIVNGDTIAVIQRRSMDISEIVVEFETPLNARQLALDMFVPDTELSWELCLRDAATGEYGSPVTYEVEEMR